MERQFGASKPKSGKRFLLGRRNRRSRPNRFRTEHRTGPREGWFVLTSSMLDLPRTAAVTCPSLRGARSYAVLVASRLAPERTEQLSLPWEEKSLSVLVACHGYTLELHSVHVPPGSTNGWVKVECLKAVFQRLARPSSHRRLLCGDFNAPQLELCDGRVVTWAQEVGINSEIRTRGRFRGGAGARCDAAERNVCLGLAEYDLRDVFRDLHGYGREAYNWVLERGGKEVRRRFDHVFATVAFQTVTCEYLQESRQSGLSDHAPVEVHFERAA